MCKEVLAAQNQSEISLERVSTPTYFIGSHTCQLGKIMEKLCSDAPQIVTTTAKKGLRTYQRCFYGSDLVTWMIANQVAKNRKDAIQIGFHACYPRLQLTVAGTQMLRTKRIKSVTKGNGFKDDEDSLYYIIVCLCSRHER